MDRYVVVPEEFVLRMAGKVSGNVEFAARQTKDGRWVCAAQSVDDFSEEFEAIKPLETAALDITDFPETSILTR